MGKQRQHWVTRGITRAWEHGNRELTYFDFQEGTFETDGSYRLFADKGLWPQRTESRFNELVETPLLQARAKVRADPWNGRTVEVTDPQVMLAMLLAIPLQAERLSTDPAPGRDGFWGLPPEQLAEVAKHVARNRRFAFVRVPDGENLVCPEHGFFPLPLPDTRLGIGVALAMPLDSEIALIDMLKTTDNEQFERLVRGPFVAHVSVSPNARRVVVPPSVLTAQGEERLRGTLQYLRAATAEMIANVDQLMGKLKEVDQAAGLPVFGPWLK